MSTIPTSSTQKLPRTAQVLMLRLASHNLWAEIRKLTKTSSRRRVAIAYVTQDLIGLRAGDVLVVDASPEAIATGETSAKLLQALHGKDVIVHSVPRLHCKVIANGDYAVVGSGNMSASSRDALVEAAFLTDSPQAVAQATALVENLTRRSRRLRDADIARLLSIPVKRRGRMPKAPAAANKPFTAGENTWLVGLSQLDDAPSGEKKSVEETTRDLAKEFGMDSDDISWIRLTGESKITREACEGDCVIKILRERPRNAAQYVEKPVGVLGNRKIGKATYIFSPEPNGRRPQMDWRDFKKLLTRLGGPKCGKNSTRLLGRDLADAIGLAWHGFAP